MKALIKKIESCRVCKKNNFTKVLSFGVTPLANAFLNKAQIDQEENFYPLEVYFCNNCTFLTLGHVVNPEVLFGNYVYVSSTSPVFIKHFEDMALDVFPRLSLNTKLVVDIGSNDGILLKPFKKMGAKVLGVEPAKHIAQLARKDEIDTIADWFSYSLAKKIVMSHGNASLVTATNVFAHIDDLDEVLTGINHLLSDDGVFIMEAPYLIDFLQKRYFDLVYHEHLSYWAVAPLITLFKRFNMEIFDVQKVNSHGGTIRVFVKKKNSYYNIEKTVARFLNEEKKLKLYKKDTYLSFSAEVLENKMNLLNIISKLKKDGKKIAGYGAPAKGNTLLNYFGIRDEFLDYIVDDSPLKQGLFTPGTRIPVVSTEKLKTDKVDYILILAWNFAESIMKKYAWFEKKGGKFIVPVPKPVVQ